MRHPALGCLALLLVLPVAVGRAAAPAPSPLYDVRAFGATGDGKTSDTAAINRAIAAAAMAGGGTVWFSAGTYASYSIHLQSNIALHLDAGATILAADPPAAGAAGGYDPPEPNDWVQFQDFGHSHWHNSLIWGENLENISITGPGRIYGRGLSRGTGRVAGPVGVPVTGRSDGEILPDGVGNKAIALKNCRNVTLRDFTILHGGHFGVLATGVDNFTIDNLTVDTNRDGVDIDACKNVRVSNCAVNSPWDDGLCLKSSHGLGEARVTENVTLTNCLLSGYDEGSLLDGTRTRKTAHSGGPLGRIKLGTESGGGFRNIAIANCTFDYCRGLALEQVDGGVMEDIAITNITMRDIPNAPVFIRIGARLRRPGATEAGTARRILISNLTAWNVAPNQGILIAGLPGHPVEDVTLDNILITYAGGGTAAQAARQVPEYEKAYPEPEVFGTLPAWGVFARHVRNLTLRGIDLRVDGPDARPAIWLDDLTDVTLDAVKLPPAGIGAARIVLKNISGFALRDSGGLPDAHRPATIESEQF